MGAEGVGYVLGQVAALAPPVLGPVGEVTHHAVAARLHDWRKGVKPLNAGLLSFFP